MVSVCMTTYNGEKYVKEQIQSILIQLSDEDELIISDDGSTDKTLEIIEQIKDPRMKLFRNCFNNVVKNFEFTIGKSVGDIIFLSDQDDIWHQNKVEKYLNFFEKTCADLVISNVAIINQDGELQQEEFYKNRFKGAVYSNLIKNNFIGCAMAFRKTAVKWFLPFPADIPMHDWWIGLVIGKKGKVSFLDEKLLYYRRHGGNVTSGKKSSFYNIIKWRWIIMKNLY